MIEENIVSAIRGAVADIRVYPNYAPENAGYPWVVYRQIDGTCSEGFYATSHESVFEIDIAHSRGLEPEHYSDLKKLTRTICKALTSDIYGVADACISNAQAGKTSDMLDNVDGLHWTRSNYTFNYEENI